MREDSIYIEIEKKSDGAIWKGEYSADYLENITNKTGSFKKFPVFAKMLLSSVKESDSVFLDLLTAQDLEKLKQKRS